MKEFVSKAFNSNNNAVMADKIGYVVHLTVYTYKLLYNLTHLDNKKSALFVSQSVRDLQVSIKMNQNLKLHFNL